MVLRLVWVQQSIKYAAVVGLLMLFCLWLHQEKMGCIQLKCGDILSWRQTHNCIQLCTVSTAKLHCKIILLTECMCVYCTRLPMIVSNLSNILVACSCLHDYNYNYIHVLTPSAITRWNLIYSNCQTQSSAAVSCTICTNLYLFPVTFCTFVQETTASMPQFA